MAEEECFLWISLAGDPGVEWLFSLSSEKALVMRILGDLFGLAEISLFEIFSGTVISYFSEIYNIIHLIKFN